MAGTDLTVEDVLAKVEEVLAEDASTCGDLHYQDGLDFLLHLGEYHYDVARWGSYRTVVYGFKSGFKTKYIGVTYYAFSGDSSGDPEPEVREYEAHEVSTVEWRPKRKTPQPA